MMLMILQLFYAIVCNAIKQDTECLILTFLLYAYKHYITIANLLQILEDLNQKQSSKSYTSP